jgi:apolipoprotein N-acyltransferase
VRRLLRWPAPWVVPAFYREMVITASAITVLMALLMYGIYRMGHSPFAPGPEVAAIQGNLPQNEKMLEGDDLPEGEAPPLEREYFPLADRAAHPGGAASKPDLVIWPETCFPLNWVELPPDDANIPDATRERVRKIITALGQYTATRMNTNTLYGLNAIDWRGGQRHKYNSALLVLSNGVVEGRYDKMHLVPFGEYVPLKDQLPWLQSFTPYTHDYSCTPGAARTRFELPTAKGTYRFGV